MTKRNGWVAVGLASAAILALGGISAWPAMDGLQVPRSAAPAGVDLSDRELAAIEGEVGPLLVLAAALAVGGGSTLFDAYQQTQTTGEVDWPSAATKGVFTGGLTIATQGLFTAGPAIQVAAKSAVMSGLRWSAAAAATAGRSIVSAAQTVGSAVVTAAGATRNAFTSAGNAVVDTFNSICGWFGRRL